MLVRHLGKFLKRCHSLKLLTITEKKERAEEEKAMIKGKIRCRRRTRRKRKKKRTEDQEICWLTNILNRTILHIMTTLMCYYDFLKA